MRAQRRDAWNRGDLAAFMGSLPEQGLLTATPLHLHPDETLELLMAGAALSPAPPDLRSGRLL